MLTSLEITDDQISGNLGNKLYLLAAMYAYAIENGHELKLPYWKFQDYFPNIPVADRRSILEDTIYFEPKYTFTPIEIGPRNKRNVFAKLKNIKGPKDLYFFLAFLMRITFTKKQVVNMRGYFQSQRYFEKYINETREFFRLSEKYQRELEERWNSIPFVDKERSKVFIQLRRGEDYDNSIHGILDLDYYEKARSRFPDADFVVFSDRIEWCKANLNWENAYFIDNAGPVEDMFLAAQCDHAIIANSSFSWWSAWFIKNPNKRVIAPSGWFGPEGQKKHSTEDMFLPEWELI